MRRGVWVMALLAGVAVLACTGDGEETGGRAEASVAQSPLPFLLGGIQVNEPDHQQWVDRLEQLGLNTVAVTAYAHQGAWNTDHLWFGDDDQWVLHEIRTARQAGLRVVLILRVALDHAYPQNRFLWHGMILPGSDEQVRSWFLRYRRFVLDWAAIAEREGVDLLGIGSELNALASTRPVTELPALAAFYLDAEKQAEYKRDVAGNPGRMELGREAQGFASVQDFVDSKVTTYQSWAQATAGGAQGNVEWINARRQLLAESWGQLIRDVREVYRGRLTYAANFDQYHEVGFWPQLDVIGINAYFPLRKRFLAADERAALAPLLEAGWRQVLAEVDAVRREQGIAGMPVVFTELGYTARRDCTLAPWAGDGSTMVWGENAAGETEKRLLAWPEQPLAPEERAAALAALHRVAAQQAPGMLAGLLYWKLSTLPQHRDVEPFVLILDEASGDPLLAELRRFQALPGALPVVPR